MKSKVYALALAVNLSLGFAVPTVALAEDAMSTTAVPADMAAASETMVPVVDVAPVVAAEAAPVVEAAPAAEEPTLDSGNTSWVLISTALVLLMTIPGLALFYGGMVRKKNVLATMMHSLTAVTVVTVLWIVAGYSLAFGDGGGVLSAYVGGLGKAMLKGVEATTLSGTIPETLFVMFQLTFAIITVAIMSGAFAERMKFSAFIVFIGIWTLVIYSPICHWVWQANGWLFAEGALDFAGGTVVHINSGIAGLVAAYVVGSRVGFGREPMAPHNLTLTLVGAGLLWVGWFGFNAGSALAANTTAAMAMLVTQVATAAASLAWMAIERIVRGKASALGAASGAIAGLVAITPAAGYVDPTGALCLGVIAGIGCFLATNYLKKLLKVDDSLDAFALHGIGGIVGALLTAVFVTSAVTGGDTKPVIDQLLIQAKGVVATLVYSGFGTWIILKVVDMVIGLRVVTDDERIGLDVTQHGESIE